VAIKIQTRDVPDLLAGRASLPDHNIPGLDANFQHWIYNGLDSTVTHAVMGKLREKLESKPEAMLSYNFVRAMQLPALAMMKRGVAINQRVRQDETERYAKIRTEAQRRLDTLADAVWGPEEYTEVVKTKELWTPVGKRGQPLTPRERTVRTEHRRTRPRGLNPNSNQQLLAFFNIALKCEVQYEIRKTPEGSVRTPSANNKALRKWAKARTRGPGIDPRSRTESPVNFAAPFVSLILTIRDADKMLAVLRTPLDPDSRMRCSYNVVGTENAGWSSSESAFGRGTNLQNITPTMRRMFCADDGFRAASTDLEQAESRLTAALTWQVTGDRAYWDACESGDLHTTVCIMAWPELLWNHNVPSSHPDNRAIAERVYPGLNSRFTYRDVAKRLGHGSNYDGSAFGISLQVGIPTEVVSDFQYRYFTAFPAIRDYHKNVKQQILELKYLDTPLGRRRWFFGRPDDPKTHREAIAFLPQSTIRELLNLALLRVMLRTPDAPSTVRLDPSDPRFLPVQLLLQNHDAFFFQFPESLDPAPILSEVKRELEIPIPFTRGRETEWLTIPGEFVVGWNWAHKDKGPKDEWKFADGNPDGLDKWRGRDDRRRQQRAATSSTDWLDRPVSRVF
jgi:hypothetical protein